MSTLRVNNITPFSGNTLTISGSLSTSPGSSLSGSFTGSLEGTASYAITASYALNGGGGSGVGFPFTGSAIISGSLIVTGSIISTSGLTGSLLGTSSWASNYIETDPVFTALSASLATTGSNTFIGTQTVGSGSLNISSGSFNIGAQSVYALVNVFDDNYDRGTLSPGGTPSTVYTSASTAPSGTVSIVSNYLDLANNGTTGTTYVTYPIPTIDTTLTSNTSSIEWSLNVRTDRTTVFSGFGSGQYGGAIILAGSDTNISSSGVGYALTYGGETSPNWRSWRLVRYSGSLNNVTTIVSPNTHSFSSPSNYVSLKVTYNPTTDVWSLFSRDDGAAAWSTIPLGSANFVGSATNTTYVSTPLLYGGFLFNHGSALNQNLQIDNLLIKAETTSSVNLFTIDATTGLSYKSGRFAIDQLDIATLSGSLIVTNGISGSLFGTANNAVLASSVGTLNQNVTVSGSLTVTSSLILGNSNISTAWTPYTPLWTSDGTQPTLGDGALSGSYKQVGKTTFVRLKLNVGTTTTTGTGTWYFSLPVSASTADSIIMPAVLLDNGNSWYQATVNGVYGGFTDKTALICDAAGSGSISVSDTAPFTWGSGDSLQFNGSYESI